MRLTKNSFPRINVTQGNEWNFSCSSTAASIAEIKNELRSAIARNGSKGLFNATVCDENNQDYFKTFNFRVL